MIYKSAELLEIPRGYEFMDENKLTVLSFRKLLVVDGEHRSYEMSRTIEGLTDAKNAFNKVFQLSQIPEEVFAAMFLDVKMQINGMTIISHGALNESLISMRELFKYALAYNTHGLIVAHNHPSGIAIPSQEDKMVTKKIKSTAKIMDIYFHDHIIIADGQHYSFKIDKLLNKKREEDAQCINLFNS